MEAVSNVITCEKGWEKLYKPIVQQIIDFDSRQSCVEDKIGVKEVYNEYGQLQIDVISYQNLISKIRREINRAKVASENICEFCGTQTDGGCDCNVYSRYICCEPCYKQHIMPHFPSSNYSNKLIKY